MLVQNFSLDTLKFSINSIKRISMDELTKFLETLKVKNEDMNIPNIDENLIIEDEFIDFILNDQMYDDPTLCEYAVENKFWRALKLLVENNCPLDSACIATAAEIGDISLIKWLIDKNCPMSYQACSLAAENNHFEVLQYLRSLDVYWDSTVLCHCAVRGDTEMAKWCLMGGCPYDQLMLAVAVEKGHLYFLIEMYTFGIPIPINDLYVQAKECGQQDIMNWLEHLNEIQI